MPKRDFYLPPDMIDRVRQLAEASAEFRIEHDVAKQFHLAGLKPFGQMEHIDDTFFIYGPRITGWLPPHNGSEAVIATAASMQGVDWSPWGIAALAESIKYENDVRAKMKDAPAAGLYFTATNADDRDSIYKFTQSDSKKEAEKHPLKVTAFVSAIPFGNMRGRTLKIMGTGTASGWHELAERLAALHPELSIEIDDSPEEAPELKQFTDNSIPAIALGAPFPKEGQPFDENAPARDDFALIHAAAALGDALKLLASGEVKAGYTAYDPVAARAAAEALKRPYLGTIPEYKTEGVAGVKLKGVREGSPAQKAGLKENDVIVELGGKAIKDVNDYLNTLEALKANEETSIKYQRDGKTESAKITPSTR
jgi:hypothetical protein